MARGALGVRARRETAGFSRAKIGRAHQPPADIAHRIGPTPVSIVEGAVAPEYAVVAELLSGARDLQRINPVRHKYGTLATCERPLKSPTACTVD